ncbi:MAG: MEDS domain-containing protein [Minicystis sp.]
MKSAFNGVGAGDLMMKDVTLAGQNLTHYHACAFFHSREEEYRVLGSFIKEGLDAGEKAMHITDPDLRDDHLARLEALGLSPAERERAGQLEVLGWNDVYLKEGRFDAETMLALIEEVVTTSMAQGFPRVRFMGHMEWALQEKPGVDEFIEYEARVNDILNRFEQPAVCIYDLSRFSGSQALDILRTHRFAIVDGELRENPYYVPPHQLLAGARGGHE